MKSLLAFRFLLLAVVVSGTSALAQRPTGAQNGALGGSLALHSMTSPLGGFATFGRTNNRIGIYGTRGAATNGGRGVYGYPYAYSVWIPDYFNYLNDMTQTYGQAYAYSAPYGVLPSSPVNYYDAPVFAPPAPPPPAAPAQAAAPTPAPGEPLVTPQTYYLIAYKDHAIYPALAYWVEDKTLHYVTTQNTHNQASMDLIDLTLTKSLNQDRNVPFSISPQ